MIAGYLGRGTRFDDSVVAFAGTYADQDADDHEALAQRFAPAAWTPCRADRPDLAA